MEPTPLQACGSSALSKELLDTADLEMPQMNVDSVQEDPAEDILDTESPQAGLFRAAVGGSAFSGAAHAFFKLAP